MERILILAVALESQRRSSDAPRSVTQVCCINVTYTYTIELDSYLAPSSMGRLFAVSQPSAAAAAL
jgi:hypothetical protein